MNDINSQNQPLQLHLTSFWKRLLAYIIDLIIIRIAAGIIVVIFAFFMRGNIGYADFGYVGSFMGIGSFFSSPFLLIVLFSLFYKSYFVSSSGQTLGKKVLNIVVVSTGGKIVRFEKAFVRALVELVPFEQILFFFTKKKQCLHDLAARTVVVDRVFHSHTVRNSPNTVEPQSPNINELDQTNNTN